MFDVFDPDAYDAPWVGEYLIRLRGPRNESFRHEFAIVEGMHPGHGKSPGDEGRYTARRCTIEGF